MNLFLAAGEIIAVIFIILLILAVIIALSSIRIVRQAQAYIIERLGRYHQTWGTGIHWLIPFIDREVKRVSLKEQVHDFDPQPVITKDNVTMQIDTVVYYQISDPKLYLYGVENPNRALENLTATTLRNIIGEIDLDQALTSRELINGKMRVILDEATDPWGLRVIRVEVKNIIPPKDIRDAMEKQMRAEREKRQAILIAEGEKQSQILKAEGFKAAQILEAEARKAVQVLVAEGEAEAILKVQQATADGIQMINKSLPSKAALQIKALDALAEVSKGQATKIIIPSEIQSLAGLIVSAKEMIADPTEVTKK